MGKKKLWYFVSSDSARKLKDNLPRIFSPTSHFNLQGEVLNATENGDFGASKLWLK